LGGETHVENVEGLVERLTYELDKFLVQQLRIERADARDTGVVQSWSWWDALALERGPDGGETWASCVPGLLPECGCRCSHRPWWKSSRFGQLEPNQDQLLARRSDGEVLCIPSENNVCCVHATMMN
jgi:hypothetical protein